MSRKAFDAAHTIGLALAVIGVVFTSAGLAQSAKPGTKGPGAVNNVPGHTPAQEVQAQESPVGYAADTATVPITRWLSPGSGQTIPALFKADDPHGKIGVINAAGAVNTKGHPFF